MFTRTQGSNGQRILSAESCGYQAGQDTATIYETVVRKLRVDRAKITEVPVKFDFLPFLQKQVDVWPEYAATRAYYILGARESALQTISSPLIPECH